MTTDSWSFNIDHNSDAGFRLWGTDVNARLAAIGLTQTADTGQIDWVTVTRAATNANAGFETWRFNDSAHGTAPIFFRLDYGTGGVANRLRIQITVGTGTNGSGTITGSVLAATIVSASAGTQVGNPLTSYLTYNTATGHLAFVFGASGGATGFAIAGFVISRTTDNDGTPNVTGAQLLLHPTGSAATTEAIIIPVRFAATSRVFNSIAGTSFSTPSNEIESDVAGDKQNFLSFIPTPRVLPMRQVCAAFIAELAEGLTATMQTVGASTNTFIQLARQLGEVASTPTPTIQIRFGLCILWE